MSSKEPSSSPRRRVLLVTEDPGLERGLTRGLARGGVAVSVAGSAKMAVQMLGAESVDVVVADEALSGMPGQELLEHLGKRFPGVASILLVGSSSRTRISLTSQQCTFPCLNRRCQPNQLLSAIARTLGGRVDEQIADSQSFATIPSEPPAAAGQAPDHSGPTWALDSEPPVVGSGRGPLERRLCSGSRER